MKYFQQRSMQCYAKKQPSMTSSRRISQMTRLGILKMPEGKIYTEEDLSDESTMKVGLHLLYNKIQGKKELHLGKSIHIMHRTFLSDVTVSIEKNLKIN